MFNQVIREVSASTNVDQIDLATLLSAETKDKDELKRIFYDGMHVTDYGSSLYAEHLTQRLCRILVEE